MGATRATQWVEPLEQRQLLSVSLVKEFSGPVYPIDVNGSLFIVEREYAGPKRLWTSDGTLAGTILLRDFGDEVPNGWGIPVGSTLFFTVSDGNNGEELWRSDGTAAGTERLMSFGGSLLQSLTNVGGTLFFFRIDAPVTNAGFRGELWKSDGTEAGTVRVKNIAPGFFLSTTSSRGMLFFSGNDGIHGDELWKSDGTEEGTVLVKDINPGLDPSIIRGLYDWNGTVFFEANDGIHGDELWKSDGTEAGTVLLKDIVPGADNGRLTGNYAEINGTLLFTASDQVNMGGTCDAWTWSSDCSVALWKTDGTEEGTVKLTSATEDIITNPFYLTACDSTAFFAMSTSAGDGYTQISLWKSDATPDGTMLVKEIGLGNAGYGISGLRHAAGRLFFTASVGRIESPETGYRTRMQFWSSDGTEAGTGPVIDCASGDLGYSPVATVSGSLYFSCQMDVDGVKRGGLWKYTPEARYVATESPLAKLEFPTGRIAGNVFFDANGNGRRNAREKGLSKRRVFLDSDNDGIWDKGELSVVTDRNGRFTFSRLPAGKYAVRIVGRRGFKPTRPKRNRYVVRLNAKRMTETCGFAQTRSANRQHIAREIDRIPV